MEAGFSWIPLLVAYPFLSLADVLFFRSVSDDGPRHLAHTQSRHRATAPLKRSGYDACDS